MVKGSVATMAITSEQTEQIQAVKSAIHRVFGSELIAIYLHGSAVSGKLRPQSDIDLLAIIDRPMTNNQRTKLLAKLLQISGRHPTTSENQRCIEVIIFLQSDLFNHSFPARAEFLYGEWLRDNFKAGKIPIPMRNPEYTLVLAQARHQSILLYGKNPAVLLPEIPIKYIHLAMREALPALLDGLQGDERNVILTLARMWYTATTSKFVTKDTAAAWAIPQMSNQNALLLDHARRAYLGEIKDKWKHKSVGVQKLAQHIQELVIKNIIQKSRN